MPGKVARFKKSEEWAKPPFLTKEEKRQQGSWGPRAMLMAPIQWVSSAIGYPISQSSSKSFDIGGFGSHRSSLGGGNTSKLAGLGNSKLMDATSEEMKSQSLI